MPVPGGENNSMNKTMMTTLDGVDYNNLRSTAWFKKR